MKHPVAVLVRWLASLIFLALGITKLYFITTHGLSDYRAIVKAAGLPQPFSYYGLLAMLVEFYVVVGIWRVKMFNSALIAGIGLVGSGTIISIFFIVYKLSNECGCGLLGDNEYGLLAQKSVLVVLLVLLWKNKKVYFYPSQ